jgi:hypothetical protein
VASSSFLLAAAAATAAAACCSSTERLKVLSDMIDKTVVVRGGSGWRQTLGLGQRCAEAKKKSMALITMLERGVPLKVR